MTIIGGLTDGSPQQLAIQLLDGTTVTWTLYFDPQQLGWFYDISWDGVNPPFTVNGNRLVAYPNILRQYRNLIPFGLTVTTVDSSEPIGQETFVDGTTTVLLLDATDVINIENAYFSRD
jgi:hypothetical protein